MKKARRIISLIIAMLITVGMMTFSVSAQQAESVLVLGEYVDLIVSKAGVYLSFVPDADGWYSFSSLSFADPWAELYDENDNVISVSDDADVDSYEFDVVAELQEGMTYYLYVGFYPVSNEDDTEEYAEVSVLTEKLETPESATIVTYPDRTSVIEGFEWDSCDLSEVQILYRFADGTSCVWTNYMNETVNGIPVNEYNEISEDGTTYIVTFECADTLVGIEFNIEENPVENVEYIGDPITLYYMYDGNFDFSYYDEEYYNYNWNLPENSNFIIHYKDGTSENYGLGENRTGCYPSYSDYQWYEPWVLGENYVVLEFLGVHDYIPVNIIESPVESVALTKDPDKLQYDGYMFPLAYGAEVTVTFKDGTKEVVEFTPDNTYYEVDLDGNPVSVAEGQGFSIKLLCQYDSEYGEFYIFECMGKACSCYGYEFDYEDDFPVEAAELVGYEEHSITFAFTLGNGVTKDVTFTDSYIIEATDYYTHSVAVSEDGVANLYTEYDEDFDSLYIYILGCEIEYERYVIGDADEDGKVNVKDATAIQKHTAGIAILDVIGRELADVDENGSVNVKDATAVQKWTAGIETGLSVGEGVFM